MLSTIILFNSIKNQLYSLLLCSFIKKASFHQKYIKNNLIPVDKMIQYSPKPIRMWIDGQCCNIKPFKEKYKKYRENELSKESTSEVYVFTDLDFTTKDNGLVTAAFTLPFYYYKKLNFDFRFDVKSLMEKTNTHISLPKINQNEKLKIVGNNEQQLKDAVQAIHSMVGQIRIESRPLQFIGIPLCDEEIKKNFMEFKKRVMEENITGFDESIFLSPLKLHLTVDVMVLMDENEKQEAICALKDYHRTILMSLMEKSGPLKIRVAGIECMNNKYDKVNVLYAKAQFVNKDNDLQSMLNNLSNYFYERGLLKKHQENVKVHMTLMNTKYRENNAAPSSSRKKRYTKKETFDATKIMEKYRDYEFGECVFSSIHISLMSSIGEDGYYKPLFCIDLKI